MLVQQEIICGSSFILLQKDCIIKLSFKISPTFQERKEPTKASFNAIIPFNAYYAINLPSLHMIGTQDDDLAIIIYAHRNSVLESMTPHLIFNQELWSTICESIWWLSHTGTYWSTICEASDCYMGMWTRICASNCHVGYMIYNLWSIWLSYGNMNKNLCIWLWYGNVNKNLCIWLSCRIYDRQSVKHMMIVTYRNR